MPGGACWRSPRIDGDRLCLGYDMEREQRPGSWRHEPDQLLLCITYLRRR